MMIATRAPQSWALPSRHHCPLASAHGQRLGATVCPDNKCGLHQFHELCGTMPRVSPWRTHTQNMTAEPVVCCARLHRQAGMAHGPKPGHSKVALQPLAMAAAALAVPHGMNGSYYMHSSSPNSAPSCCLHRRRRLLAKLSKPGKEQQRSNGDRRRCRPSHEAAGGPHPPPDCPVGQPARQGVGVGERHACQGGRGGFGVRG